MNRRQQLLQQLPQQLLQQKQTPQERMTRHAFLINGHSLIRGQKHKIMDYGKYKDFMHPDIKEALKSGSHPLYNNNAYPLILTTNDNSFEEECAKKRFEDVILKYQQIMNIVGAEPRQFANVLMTQINVLFNYVIESTNLELPHRKLLEDLAVEIISKDFNIAKGDVIFNVKITGFGETTFPSDTIQEKEDMMEPPEINEDNYTYDEDDEVQKRQFINALISGASKKGHYIFHLAKPHLDQLDDNLIPLYQIIMSLNDLTYFLISDDNISMASQSDNNDFHAGFEKLTFNEDGVPVITVEAVNFPTLIHEIIKGVLELIATLALPNDKPLLDYIYDMSDYLLAEPWYLRLGPIFWERLMNCFPREYTDIKAQLLGNIFKLETDEFNSLMKSVLSDENQNFAKSYLLTQGKLIKENIRSYNQANS